MKFCPKNFGWFEIFFFLKFNYLWSDKLLNQTFSIIFTLNANRESCNRKSIISRYFCMAKPSDHWPKIVHILKITWSKICFLAWLLLLWQKVHNGLEDNEKLFEFICQMRFYSIIYFTILPTFSEIVFHFNDRQHVLCKYIVRYNLVTYGPFHISSETCLLK